MTDTDLIARVYPYDLCEDILQAFKENSRYVPPQKRRVARHERLPTEPLCDREPTYHYKPCIEVRFSNIPRTRHGLVFGSDPKCDVVIPDECISWHHFSLTFDDARRFVIKDWGSSGGTEVTYDDCGKGIRSGFQWIFGGHRIPRRTNEIIIKLDQATQFQIVVAHHNTELPDYIEKVDQFRLGTATAEELFRDLDFPRETKQHTGAYTPSAGAIYLTRKLGQGLFSVVDHY